MIGPFVCWVYEYFSSNKGPLSAFPLASSFCAVCATWSHDTFACIEVQKKAEPLRVWEQRQGSPDMHPIQAFLVRDLSDSLCVASLFYLYLFWPLPFLFPLPSPPFLSFPPFLLLSAFVFSSMQNESLGCASGAIWGQARGWGSPGDSRPPGKGSSILVLGLQLPGAGERNGAGTFPAEDSLWLTGPWGLCSFLVGTNFGPYSVGLW